MRLKLRSKKIAETSCRRSRPRRSYFPISLLYRIVLHQAAVRPASQINSRPFGAMLCLSGPRRVILIEVCSIPSPPRSRWLDVMSQRQCVIFGRDEIRRIAEVPCGSAVAVRTLYVGLDQDTDELATLCGVVVSFKGHHAYVAGQPFTAT
jgi:hypothetical protein